MSAKTQLEHSLREAAGRLGGSHYTVEARERTLSRFSAVTASRFNQARDATYLGGKHLQHYVDQRKEDGASARTIQNEMAHLRTTLTAAGMDKLVRDRGLSNENLGCPSEPGDRTGSKTALSAVDYAAARERAFDSGRPGMAAALGLQHELGLRAMETIRARLDVLQRMERQLEARQKVSVLEGTKGGRPRDVTPIDREKALEAVREAKAVAAAQGGYLITRHDGSPAGSLESARNIYKGWMQGAGIQPHSARYAWAAERVAAYERAGFSPREARVATALDLGHGDGRGRWVQSVYLR